MRIFLPHLTVLCRNHKEQTKCLCTTSFQSHRHRRNGRVNESRSSREENRGHQISRRATEKKSSELIRGWPAGLSYSKMGLIGCLCYRILFAIVSLSI